MTKTLESWLRNGGTTLALIGKQVRYAGKYYEIIDVLHEEQSLVLSSNDHEEVQEDRYGRAHRLVPHTEVVTFCNEEGHIAHICQEMMMFE
ncbi:MAG: hypothetical protein Q9M09_06015 [Mariprofundaceae bacterium]|nr:hypothetical protein [Mariprofundaceae bacterium]